MAGANPAYGSYSSGRRPGVGGEIQREAPGLQEVLAETGRGLGTTLASALRGAAKATLGTPGDVVALVNQLRQRPDAATLLPTSEEVGSVLPEVPGGSDSYEGLGAYLDPKALAKKGGVSLAALTAASLRRDLFLARGVPPEHLFKDGKLIQELSSPSMAIMKDRLPSMYGDAVLIPQHGKFDPKTHNAALYSEDAFTPSYRHEILNDPKERLDERLSGMSSGTWPFRYEQEGEKHAPQMFKSFAEYEKSHKGAGRLRQSANQESEFPPELDNALASYMAREDIDDMGTALFDINNYGAPLKGDEYKIRSWLRNKSPTDYAELKVHGPVPFNKDNFAGVIMKAGRPEAEELARALRERGLSFAETTDLRKATHLARLMQETK